MSEDVVIRTLEEAVSAQPEQLDLRVHLASLYYERCEYAASLSQCQLVLAKNPLHIAAVDLATRAALADGNNALAEAYAKISNSLSTQADTVAVTPATPSQSPEIFAMANGVPKPDDTETLQPENSIGLRLVSDNTVDEFDADDHALTTPALSLADVAGLEQVKRRLELAFLGPLRNPELAKAYKKGLSGGLLLYGPPGCGKTYIARALAGELRAHFISIGISDVLDKYLGESERKMHALFEQARSHAPAVIFIDELDALGRKRSDLGSSGVREVVNQLLTEMDGIAAQQSDAAVYVIGASNVPWDIDGALKRPGRFDRTVFVEPPDLQAREQIISAQFSDRPVEKINYAAIAKKTAGYSGADLSFVCEMATELALEAAMSTGKPTPVTNTEVKRALKEVKPSIKSWFETAQNYVAFANTSGEYDAVADYLNNNRL